MKKDLKLSFRQTDYWKEIVRYTKSLKLKLDRFPVIVPKAFVDFGTFLARWLG